MILLMIFDELYNFGLKEVKCIKNDMFEIKDEVKFEGILNEFFDYVCIDFKFKFESCEVLIQSYYDIGCEVDEKIDQYFLLLLKFELEIKFYDFVIE